MAVASSARLAAVCPAAFTISVFAFFLRSDSVSKYNRTAHRTVRVHVPEQHSQTFDIACLRCKVHARVALPSTRARQHLKHISLAERISHSLPHLARRRQHRCLTRRPRSLYTWRGGVGGVVEGLRPKVGRGRAQVGDLFLQAKCRGALELVFSTASTQSGRAYDTQQHRELCGMRSIQTVCQWSVTSAK